MLKLYQNRVSKVRLDVNLAAKKAILQYRSDSIDPAKQMARLAVNEILRSEGRFTIHSGALEYKGGGVLICAGSGMGKSTMTAAWAYSGMARFIADDQCVLFRKSGTIWLGGISNTLALLPQSEELLSNSGVDIPNSHKQFAQKNLFAGPDFFIQSCPDPYPVKTVLFLVDGTDGDNRLRPCPPDLAGKLLMEASFYIGKGAVMREHFKTIMDLEEQAHMYLVPRGIDCKVFVSQAEKTIETSAIRSIPLYPRSQLRSPQTTFHDIDQATKSLCRIISESISDKNLNLPQSRELKDVVKMADHHGLFALLATTLKAKVNLGQLQPDLINAMEKEIWQTSTARKIHLETIHALDEALKAKAVMWSVIHGPSIAERFYGFPEARFYSDLNIVTLPEMAGAAATVLKELRFLPSGSSDNRNSSVDSGRYDFIRNTASRYSVQLVTSYPALGAGRCTPVNKLNAFMRRIATLNVGGTSIPVASPCDQIIFSCIRSSQSFRWHSLLFYLDLFLMMEHLPQNAYDKIRQEAVVLGFFNMLALSLRRAAFFFPSDKLSSITKKLRPSVLAKLLSFLFDPDSAVLKPWRPSIRIRMKLFRNLVEKGII